MKKILFISTGISQKLLAQYGVPGGDVRLAEIMRAVLKDNSEVHLLTTNGAQIFCQKFDLKNVNCHDFKIKSGFVKRLDFILLSIKTLFTSLPLELKSFNQGIVYSANELPWDVLPALRFKFFRKNIKWAAVVHWLPPAKFWTRKNSGFLTSFFYFIGERLSVLLIKYFADLILPVSNSTTAQLKKIKVNPQKIFTVKCGVNFNQFSELAQTAEKKYDAIFMKRAHRVKGLFDLIDIWQEVLKLHLNAKLAVVGGGFDLAEARQLVKEKQLDQNIIFFGHIADIEEKIKILTSARIFVLPSYEENWAIVIGEAMAAGLPVLAYDLPELRDVWQNNFVSIPIGNKKVFAQKIIQFFNDQTLVETYVKVGQNYVRQFNWTEVAGEEILTLKKL